jgi:AcrR family transcriptional regulator
MARTATLTKPRTRQCAEDRRRLILAAAQKVFLERGYANASIDAVVELAGGSKATVYQQFGSKEGLLGALVQDGAEELAHLVHDLPLDGALEESLRTFGRGYLGLIMRPERLALFRLTIGECGRVPEIGDVFYRTGPQVIGKWLTEFFRNVAAAGLIKTTDPERIAYQFIHALRGDLYMQALLNPTRRPTETEIDRHIDFVIAAFLDGARPAELRAKKDNLPTTRPTA